MRDASSGSTDVYNINSQGRADVINAQLKAVLFATGMLVIAAAQGDESDKQRLSITGFVRQELALAVGGNENPFNQWGNLFNGQQPVNTTFGGLGFNNFPRTVGAQFASLYNANNELPAYFADEPSWNVMNTRLEIDVQYEFSNTLSGYLKFRAYGDGTDHFESAYNGTDFFGNPFHGNNSANLLEVNDNHWSLDLPAAYLDYHTGPWWLRAGNQQIAWGEAIFFRVLDVVNGLDLRRHSFLDVAGEEYADERVPSLGLRLSYTFANNFEIDSFVQHFQPTVYGNENSPYNVIPSQFVIAQEEGYDRADTQFNFGARMTMPLTDDFTVQVMGVSRRNPEGVFRWTEAPADAPGAVCVPGVGCTPFQGDGRGVYSSQEWFTYASMARLNGVDGLQSVYDDFPAAELLRTVFGLPVATDKGTALTSLDFFFAGGPLRGWLSREYPREEVFGLAANYIVTAEPGSVLDQLVLRGEVSYSPNRKFTNPSLSRGFIKDDEFIASAVLEKYHRFSEAFPSTFMVLEWMFRSDSDMYGRHLSGMGSDGFDEADGRPDGNGSFNAFAFAMQQPFPNLIWRADLAVLVDVRGGWLIQPGLRYKPSANWQFDLYANIVTSDGGNNDVMQTFDWSDELFGRVSFFF